MTESKTLDLVIAGGGLAGLCLARQLSQARPETSVLVVEQGERPAPHACFKIGESSVEVAGHYLHNVLGLAEHLDEGQLPKLGLRYFMSAGDNRDIARRLEFGPIRHKVPVPFDRLLLPSYQLDRGRLENHLISVLVREAPQVTFKQQTRVNKVDLGVEGDDHLVHLRSHKEDFSVRTRWFIDASGTASLLGRQLDNEVQETHHCNAVWARLDTRIRVDDWSEDPAYALRVGEHARWRSTVHLMGRGYWVWLIPLSGGETSIGLVADERVHPYRSIASWTKLRVWLSKYEPQLAEKVEAVADQQLDFAARHRYSRSRSSVTGGEARWGMTGDAALFTDPLYSPGSDFISIINTMHTDLISRDLDGEPISARAERSNYYLKLLYDQFMEVYRDGYLVLGNPRVNTVKLVFDNAFYWGWVALLGMNARATDPDLLDPFHDEYMRSVSLMCGFQRFLREWNEVEVEPLTFDHVDQFDLQMLWSIYTVLIKPVDGESLRRRLSQTLDRLEAFCEDVFRRLFAGDPEVEEALGIDVSHLSLDRSRWAELGTLKGPDRSKLVARISAGMTPLWEGSRRDESAA